MGAAASPSDFLEVGGLIVSKVLGPRNLMINEQF